MFLKISHHLTPTPQTADTVHVHVIFPGSPEPVCHHNMNIHVHVPHIQNIMLHAAVLQVSLPACPTIHDYSENFLLPLPNLAPPTGPYYFPSHMHWLHNIHWVLAICCGCSVAMLQRTTSWENLPALPPKKPYHWGRKDVLVGKTPVTRVTPHKHAKYRHNRNNTQCILHGMKPHLLSACICIIELRIFRNIGVGERNSMHQSKGLNASIRALRLRMVINTLNTPLDTYSSRA